MVDSDQFYLYLAWAIASLALTGGIIADQLYDELRDGSLSQRRYPYKDSFIKEHVLALCGLFLINGALIAVLFAVGKFAYSWATPKDMASPLRWLGLIAFVGIVAGWVQRKLKVNEKVTGPIACCGAIIFIVWGPLRFWLAILFVLLAVFLYVLVAQKGTKLLEQDS